MQVLNIIKASSLSKEDYILINISKISNFIVFASCLLVFCENIKVLSATDILKYIPNLLLFHPSQRIASQS